MNKILTMFAVVFNSWLTFAGYTPAGTGCTEWTDPDTGIVWTYKVAKGMAIVVESTGNGEVAIPSSLGGCPVTSIGERAFSSCSVLTSVTIPSSVTNIGSSAFWGCSGLTSVTIPNGVTSIGEYAFYNCYVISTVAIPPTVIKIGKNAFKECNNLWKIKVGIGETTRIKRLLNISGFNLNYVEFEEVDVNELIVHIPDPDPDPTPEPEPSHKVVDEVVGEVPVETAAVTYDGYLCDSDGAVVGTVSVKAAKAKKDKSKLSITVQMAGSTKKVSISGEYDLTTGGEQTFTKNGQSITLKLGANGMTGSYAGYAIEGVPNVFTAKDADSKAAASAAETAYLGTYNLMSDEGVFTISVAKKGKVKVTGTTTDGKKLSVSTSLLVGNEIACAVIIAPKLNLSFTVWFGDEMSVQGLEDAVIGKPGTLTNGARFTLDSSELAILVGDDKYAEYFPSSFPITVSGTKWTFAKAGKVVLNKSKTGVDETKLGDNPSALKLTYTAKTGTFKGSFKAYVDNKGKPKAITVSVTGVLIDGVGYGTAMVKKAGSCVVMIQ